MCIIQVCTCANRLFVHSAGYLFLCSICPEMFWNYSYIVQIISPFLVERLGEIELQCVVINLYNLSQIVPHLAIINCRELLANLEGELDIIGCKRFTVAPGDALSYLQFICDIIGPFSTLC
ncbi:hypothetical protein ES703_39250 [subsurface metagenome]